MWWSRGESNPQSLTATVFKTVMYTSSNTRPCNFVCISLRHIFNYTKDFNLVKIQRTKNYQKLLAFIMFVPNRCSVSYEFIIAKNPKKSRWDINQKIQ